MKPIRKFYKSSTFIKIQTQLSNNLHFLHEILDSIGVLYIINKLIIIPFLNSKKIASLRFKKKENKLDFIFKFCISLDYE